MTVASDELRFIPSDSNLKRFAEENRISVVLLRLEPTPNGTYDVLPYKSINLERAKKKVLENSNDII